MLHNSIGLILIGVLLASGLGPPAHAQDSGSQAGRGQFLGAKPTEYPPWFKESFLEFQLDVEEAAESGKRLLVMFHQDGCPYCNQLVEVNLAQRDIEQYVRAHFDVVALNLWGDREVVTVAGKAYTEKTFAAALRVQFTPTLLFFDEGGKVVLRLNGYQPPGQFKTALRFVAEKHEKRGSFTDYLAANAPPAATGALNEQAFFSPPPHDLGKGRAGKPLAVFFEQRDCPNCDTLHGKVLTDPQTRALLRDFHAVQLDMWSQTPLTTPDNRPTTARAWAKQLAVVYAPSIVLFDRDGAEVIRSEAYFKRFHTQSLFHYVLHESYRHEPSFQRYLSERADALRDQGIEVNIWD